MQLPTVLITYATLFILTDKINILLKTRLAAIERDAFSDNCISFERICFRSGWRRRRIK